MDVSGGFFRQMVESSRDGIWVFDASGRTIYTNDRAAELLGRTTTEMSSLAIADVLDHDGRAQLASHLEELGSAGPNAGDVECTYLRPDGTPVPLLVGESVLCDEDGIAVAYVHRLSEDSERRSLLEELSRSEEQLAEAQSIARLGSWELDGTTEELTWSRQLYAIFGLDPDEFIPTRAGFYGRVIEADRPKVSAVITRAEEVGGDFGVDCRVLRSDGAEVWVRLLGRVTLADGVPVRLGGTVQDISAVKEAELKLLDAVVLNMLMQVMASAANSARTLAEALDVIRSQLLAHDDWTRAVAFRAVMDPETGDVVELAPYMVDEAGEFEPNAYEWTVADQVLANGGSLMFEESLQPQNPSMSFAFAADDTTTIVVVLTNTAPFERHAMLTSMVDQVKGQLSQVAARERAAQELAEARDAAMEASALKSEFLATMSHEIRTPMNGVIGLNELLLRSELDPHQRRLAQGVQLAGQSLLGLINDILDFSKIEAGQLELEVVDFEVRAVFTQVIGIVSAAASDKGLPIELTVDPEVPERLVGDPTRLGQVVSNLVSNSVKFTHEGSIDVHVSVTEAVEDAVLLRVQVHDTGIGIGEEQMARLFEPFRQADASTTRTFGGTGLGLAISTQLVAALGGDIGATSALGQGSTFWFTGKFGPSLTAGGSTVTPSADAPDTETGCAACARILVAEDNEINQLVALGLLEALGYDADVAENGEQAVAMAAEGDYAAILMDVQMPRMDGYTASRRIRASEPDGVRVPIIAMTASAVIGERERCEAAGMDDFLTKPVNSERLSSTLRSYVVAATVNHDRRAEVDEPIEPPVVARASRVLDETRLEELTEMGERAQALVVRAVDNFLARVPEVLAELRSAIDRDDATELRAVAHGFRGSALNLGAARAAEIALDLELLAEAGKSGSGDPLVAELDQALVETVAALDAYRTVRLSTAPDVPGRR